MTTAEAFRAMGEIISVNPNPEKVKHLEELASRILDGEVPFPDTDPELDKKWQEEN